MPHAIEVAGVSKTYRIPHEVRTTLAERLTSLFRPVPVEELAALSDVSLTVPRGSAVGIIGANGSGKSTLLKIMTGLLVPDTGTVRVDGSLAPLLELGLGFQHELTVRENVALYGAILGYPRREMERCIDEAIAFAELERFRDAKLKSLSSGMIARLGFATALRADADILLLDEVLAVGDAHFQQKCLATFEELRRRQKTLVLVSHDLHTVQRICDQAYWLDRGRLAYAGPTGEVVGMYLSMARGDGPEAGLAPADPNAGRVGDGRIRFVYGGIENEHGSPITIIRAGTRVLLRLVVQAEAAIEEPAFGFVVWHGGRIAYSTNTVLLAIPGAPFSPGDRAELRIPFTAWLANGVYMVSAAAADRTGGTIYDWVNHVATFVVEGSTAAEGTADLAATFDIERTAPGTPTVTPLARAQR
jgi:ABC-type polysaccharide/polyol phosphate transport system ATPase subunit